MTRSSKPKKEATDSKEKNQAIAIVGNLNVGKSTLFSLMSGGKTTSLNMAGNTAAISSGHTKGTNWKIFDTPGICSVFSNNEEERASRDILLPHTADTKIKGILLVADAKNLNRSIAIALQYAEYGLPMLLDINMIDEASPRGIEIDHERLSEIFGINVCTSVAREGIGISKIMSNVYDMKIPNRLVEYPVWIKHFIEIIAKLVKTADISPSAIGLLMLVNDSAIERYLEDRFGIGLLDQIKELVEEYRLEEAETIRVLLANLYNKKAAQIVDEVQKRHPPSENPFVVRFGDWCTKLSTGIPIAIAILFAVYLFVGTFGATFLVDTINGFIFNGFLIPWTTRLLAPIPSEFIRDMIIDPDFGILPTGVFLALGLVLPVLFCFYLAFGILDDSGYLPRISVLLDRLLQKIGLNGKGVIPLVMGFSCITMAILTTRMLDTKKQKNIATFLLLLGMPCAPLLAVMLVILGNMPVSASATVFGLIFSQILIAGYIANNIVPGARSPLLMEIPAMRIPKFLQILKTSASKTYFFMKEAVPVFVLASLLVFLFERVGGLEVLEKILKPVISGLMGLPEKSVQVFIKTIIRRESGATEIEHLIHYYDNVQIVVNLLVMTFLSPCMNAVIVLFKERGAKVASVIVVSVMIYAILIGSLVSHVCRFLGVTFT